MKFCFSREGGGGGGGGGGGELQEKYQLRVGGGATPGGRKFQKRSSNFQRIYGKRVETSGKPRIIDAFLI